MNKVVVLHGTQGSPEGNWFKWLKHELEAKKLQVWLPELPNAKQPSLTEWVEFVKENCPFEIDDDTFVIGHSSGAILAFVLAQKVSKPIGATVCVSVFHDNSLKWEANDKLFDVDFDFKSAKNNAKERLVIHSDDDPYVPVEQAKYVADNIGAEFILIPGQGHFNLEKSKAYNKFPKLLEILEERKLV